MSLRSRLLIGMAVIALVLGVAATVIARSTEAHLIDQVDDQLRGVGAPARFLREPGPFGGAEGTGVDPDVLSSLYVGIITTGDTVRTVFRPNVTAHDLPPPAVTIEQAREAAAAAKPFTVGTSGSDVRYRVLARLHLPQGRVVLVALPLRDVDDAVARLVTVEMAAIGAVLAVLGLVTWWVVRHGIRPLKQMTATALAIGSGDLSRRVPDVTPGTEAGDLGQALNQMLATIERAFDERARSDARLRQFVADASHELRTPVTTIRGYAELYRSGGLDDPAELDEAIRRTEEEAIRMGDLIDDLLHLAHLDQGRPLERAPVDLEDLARDAVRDAQAVDPNRTITAITNGTLVVAGDERRLRQVLANLVGNALAHTPSGTPIEVRLRRDGDLAVLEVADRGSGMPTEVAARAFERFFRADPSRSRHHGGTGLGLSIVDATVRAHGGRATLESVVDEGTTVRVELPIGAEDSAEGPRPFTACSEVDPSS